MKALITLLIFTFTFNLSINAQNESDLLDPSSESFQVELTKLQIQNPHLGPNHDLVYPGDTLVFEDGSKQVIQTGEYESILLLDYLRNNNLDPEQLVSIIQASNQNDIDMNGSNIPWYIWLPLWLGVACLGIIALHMADIFNRLGPVNIEHHYHERNASNSEEEQEDDEDEIIHSMLLLALSGNLGRSRSSAPLIHVEGDNNTVNVGEGSSVSGFDKNN
ncbi:MAG: hypothetical protein WDZ80_05735 [Candidatus Paceibacterota bacterium]